MVTVSILTTTPHELTNQVHVQMPVILKPVDEATWIDPAIDDTDMSMSIIGPYPAGEMVADAASPAVNRPQFQGSEWLVPPALVA